MPTDAELAQVAAKRKKDLLLAEQAARREQAEATLTNLMTGETGPMTNQRGPLASVDLTPLQNLMSGRESLNKERDELLAERETDLADTQAFLKRIDEQESPIANLQDQIEGDATQTGLIPRTVPVYPGAKDAMAEKPAV